MGHDLFYRYLTQSKQCQSWWEEREGLEYSLIEPNFREDKKSKSAEEVDYEREIQTRGCLVEAPDLLDNPFASDGLSCYTDEESKHRCTTIQLFIESFGWVNFIDWLRPILTVEIKSGWIGSCRRGHWCVARAATLTNVTTRNGSQRMVYLPPRAMT